MQRHNAVSKTIAVKIFANFEHQHKSASHAHFRLNGHQRGDVLRFVSKPLVIPNTPLLHSRP